MTGGVGMPHGKERLLDSPDIVRACEKNSVGRIATERIRCGVATRVAALQVTEATRLNMIEGFRGKMWHSTYVSLDLAAD
jgi:hypothetical protein